ncbi:MAG: hypothetical protein AB1403_10440 [Candidatus Riflebacteria bacterium]
MKENSTLQDYYKNLRRLRLAKASKILNIYLVISVLNFVQIFGDHSSTRCANVIVDPLEQYLNICLPIGFLVFLWSAKLAIDLKEWRQLSINLAKLLLPFPLVLKNYWLIAFMNIEMANLIWWPDFLK